MAWITPVTDRKSDRAKMTYTDMNRISGNCQELLDFLYVAKLSPIKTVTTTYSQNHIVTTNEWYGIVAETNHIKTTCFITGDDADTAPHYLSVNRIEEIHELAGGKVAGLYEATIYAGEIYGGEI